MKNNKNLMERISNSKAITLFFIIKTVVSLVLTILILLFLFRNFMAIKNDTMSDISTFAAEVEQGMEEHEASMQARKENGEQLQREYDEAYSAFLESQRQHEQYHQDHQDTLGNQDHK